jgi:hypothetical protein
MSAKRADEINLSDPRVTAAMKVLGIKEENLIPREFECPKDASEAREEMAKMRHKKHEELRQRWLKEVKDAAAEINETDVDALMGPSTSMPSQSAQNFENMSFDRLEKQKEKLEEQRKRNRSEIQRALEEKMNSEQKAETEKKREEDQRKRLMELRKEQKVKVQSQVDKRKERTSKNQQNLLNIAQSAREKMRELDNKLKTTCRVAWEKAQSARIGDEKKRREHRERVEKLFEARDSKDEKSHSEFFHTFSVFPSLLLISNSSRLCLFPRYSASRFQFVVQLAHFFSSRLRDVEKILLILACALLPFVNLALNLDFLLLSELH